MVGGSETVDLLVATWLGGLTLLSVGSQGWHRTQDKHTLYDPQGQPGPQPEVPAVARTQPRPRSR